MTFGSRSMVFGAALTWLLTGSAYGADAVTVQMHMVSAKGQGAAVGTIKLSNSKNGFLQLDLDLSNALPPGGHGFHIHENGDCGAADKDGAAVAGLAAGGHFDPDKAGRHEGPSGKGHRGDLPILFVQVDEDGATPTNHTLIAPRLKLADVLGRSIMIHENSDNFADTPAPLGGGGARIACGVIPAK